MNGIDFQKALRNGENVYGMMLVSRSPKFAEVIATLGMDYIFIDTEHIEAERTTISFLCRHFAAAGIAPLVRIPAPDPYEASVMLDGGAAGIIAPYVESAEQVRALVGAVKYKPLKGRRLERILHGEETLEPKLAAYLEQTNAGKSVIVNIESKPAMEALDEILAVPGLDAVLIGPHDLSSSLGIPEEYENPIYDQAVREILSKARRAGVGAGIHVHYHLPDGREIEQQAVWSRETGSNFIVHHSDILAFTIAMRRDLAALKTAMGGGAALADGGNINL